MARTKVDWADEVWNPVWGCTGSCPYCYARKRAKMSGLRVCGRDDFAPTWIEKNFQRKFKKDTRRVFVNSMSDVADWKPIELARVDQKIRNHYPGKLFLMLTKRPGALGWFGPSPNTMLGYSVTRQDDLHRLRRAGDNVTFLSIEPILEPIDLALLVGLQCPRWIIVGAETGNRKGKVVPKLEWLMDIRKFCFENKIPLFFKGSLRRYYYNAYFPQEYPSLQ